MPGVLNPVSKLLASPNLLKEKEPKVAVKIPYTRELKLISDGAAAVHVYDHPVRSGLWLFLQHVGARDLDNAPTKIIVARGVKDVVSHLFEEEPAPAADVLYHTEKTYFIPEGQNLIVIFEGTVEGDHLEVYLDGYLTPKVEAGRVFAARKVAAK